MILNLEFNGYRFFNDSKISFNADVRTSKLLSNSELIGGKNVLKTVGLYGANNSGKTNISVLFFLIKKVLLGHNDVCFNNPIFEDSDVTKISITFNNLNDYGWFKYVFSYNNIKKSYEKEMLSQVTYYDNGTLHEKEIFLKDNEKELLRIFNDDKSMYLSVIPSRLPLLYSVELGKGEFSSLKNYLDELQYFANSIEIIQMYNIPIDNTINTLKKGDAKKIRFVKEFVKSADISIDDFDYDDNSIIRFEPRAINEKVLLNDNILDSMKLVTTYNNKKVPSIVFDSTGTKKIEAIASYVYDAIENGKTLIIDELDNGLHFKLTRSIVSVFNNLINKRSQLIFITHDMLLIDSNKLIRKDQIYFVNRNKEGASLYCLKRATAENGGPRDLSDIIKRYNRGEFGDVPNPSFLEPLLGVLNNEQTK